eukprot:1149106-Pelagomonas_calceolata.AAC.3
MVDKGQSRRAGLCILFTTHALSLTPSCHPVPTPPFLLLNNHSGWQQQHAKQFSHVIISASSQEEHMRVRALPP